MSFILSAERDADPEGSRERYDAYLKENRHRFPEGARELIDSDWYFTFANRAPHDAWLESVTISEPEMAAEDRWVSIRICLQAAYGEGHIEFFYSKVSRYTLSMGETSRGHGDWRYDEFRISDTGKLIHEIDWWGRNMGKWLIEADDVKYSWHP